MIHPGCPGTLLAAVRPVLQLKMAQLHHDQYYLGSYAPAVTVRPGATGATMQHLV